MTFLVTRFDFRAPGADPAARQELFSRALDQAAYAEGHGQDALTLSEHHGSDDGYLPSPLTVAAAMAARTRSMPISVAALVVNLHDPVRLAEDIAVLDHLSAGRVTYTLGLGYRREEYAMFGRPWHSRADDVETAIATLRTAWAGEPVERDGRRVRVTPVPFSRPHPVLLYGGGSAAAARRAARLGLGFQPQVSDRGLRELYRAECRRLGREPGLVMMPPARGPAYVFCTEDPDRFWALHGHHLLADAVATSTWHGRLPSAVVRPVDHRRRAARRRAVRRPDAGRARRALPLGRGPAGHQPSAVRRAAGRALVGEPPPARRGRRPRPAQRQHRHHHHSSEEREHVKPASVPADDVGTWSDDVDVLVDRRRHGRRQRRARGRGHRRARAGDRPRRPAHLHHRDVRRALLPRRRHAGAAGDRLGRTPPPTMAAYLRAMSPDCDPEKIRLYAEGSVEHFGWLESLGLRVRALVLPAQGRGAAGDRGR